MTNIRLICGLFIAMPLLASAAAPDPTALEILRKSFTSTVAA